MRTIYTAEQQQVSETNRCTVPYHWLNIETGRHKKETDQAASALYVCARSPIQTSLLIALMPLILMRMLLIP